MTPLIYNIFVIKIPFNPNYIKKHRTTQGNPDRECQIIYMVKKYKN